MPLFSKNSPGSPLMPPPSREYIAKARASPPKKLAPLALPSADISDDAAKVPRGKIEMQPALLAEFAGLIDAIGPAICQLLPGEAGLAKGLQHIFKAVVDAAGGSLEAVACLLKELSTGHLFDGIKHFLSNIATTVGCTLDEVYQAVQALLGGVEDLTGSIGEIVECILKNVGELLSEIKKGVVALLKCILPTKLFASIEALVGGILREVSSLVDLRCLFENIEHLLCTVFSAVRFLLQNVASIVFTILCDTKKVVDGVLVATGKVVSDAMGLVKEVLGDVFRLVRHALCEVAVFLRGLFGGVSGFLCHLLLDIEQLLCSILGGPHHCLGAVDKIGCAIGKVFPAIEQSALCLFGHIQRKGVDSKGALKLCLHEVSGNFLCDLFTELKGFLEMVAKAVGCTLSDVFAAVRMILNGVACETSKIVSYILANVGCLLDGIKKAVVCLLKKVLPAGLFCSIEKLLSTLCSVANLVDLRKLFRGIWGLVSEVLCFTKFLLAGVGCLVREILTESGELVNGVLCKTGKVVHNTLELVKEVVGDALCYVHGLLEKVGCFVEELLGSIDTFLCWLFTEVSKLVGAILHGVSWILGQVNKIFPAICALLPGIDGIVSDILSGVACVVQDELDQVKLLLEAIGCAVAKILKPIRCFLEFIAKEVGCTVKEVFCAVKALLCGVGGLVGKTLKIVQCILANVGRLVQDVLAGVVCFLQKLNLPSIGEKIAALVGTILCEVRDLVDLRGLFCKIAALLHGIFDFTCCLLKNVEWLVCTILGDVTALVRDVLGSVMHELCVVLEDVAVFVYCTLGGVNCLVSAIFHDVICLLKGILCPKHDICCPGTAKRMGLCFVFDLLNGLNMAFEPWLGYIKCGPGYGLLAVQVKPFGVPLIYGNVCGPVPSCPAPPQPPACK